MGEEKGPGGREKIQVYVCVSLGNEERWSVYRLNR